MLGFLRAIAIAFAAVLGGGHSGALHCRRVRGDAGRVGMWRRVG